MLAAPCQLKHSFGDHSHGRVFAIDQTQGAQRVFKSGRDDSDFFRREGPASDRKRPNKHDTNPQANVFTTSTELRATEEKYPKRIFKLRTDYRNRPGKRDA
jgi:hypothetical protein